MIMILEKRPPYGGLFLYGSHIGGIINFFYLTIWWVGLGDNENGNVYLNILTKRDEFNEEINKQACDWSILWYNPFYNVNRIHDHFYFKLLIYLNWTLC